MLVDQGNKNTSNWQRYYFNSMTGMLLDIAVGIFKYDADTHSMVLIYPFRRKIQKLLLSFSIREDEIVTKGWLSIQLWDGQFVGPHSIPSAIYELRKALAYIDADGCCIITTPRVGYIFSPKSAGLFPIRSLDFLLESLRWISHPQDDVFETASNGLAL